jgi:hypothetical protein
MEELTREELLMFQLLLERQRSISLEIELHKQRVIAAHQLGEEDAVDITSGKISRKAK